MVVKEAGEMRLPSRNFANGCQDVVYAWSGLLAVRSTRRAGGVSESVIPAAVALA